MRISSIVFALSVVVGLSGCFNLSLSDAPILTPSAESSSEPTQDNDLDASIAPLLTLPTDSQFVGALAWSTDSRWVAAGTSSATIWDVLNNESIGHFERPDRPESPDLQISVLRFSEDNKHLISGWYDGTVIVWDISSGEEVARLTGLGPIGILEVIPNSEKIAVGTSSDRFPKLSLWDLESATKIWEISDLPVVSMATDEDGEQLLVGRYDTRASLIDVDTGQFLWTITVFDIPCCGSIRIDSVDFADGDNVARTVGHTGSIRDWNIDSQELLNSVDTPVETPITYSTLSGATQFMASIIHGESEILIWDPTFRQTLGRIAATQGERFADVAWSPDGSYLASASFSGEITIWESPK